MYAQADELQNNWKEGGAYRIAAHAAVGGLTGGAAGAASAAASGLAVPAIADQIADLDMPAPVKQALAAAIGGAVDASIGGSAGGAAGFTETTNNFLTAKDLRNKDQKIAACQAANDPGCEVNVIKEYELRNMARNFQSFSPFISIPRLRRILLSIPGRRSSICSKKWRTFDLRSLRQCFWRFNFRRRAKNNVPSD